jgi:hypothetical protein
MGLLYLYLYLLLFPVPQGTGEPRLGIAGLVSTHAQMRIIHNVFCPKSEIVLIGVTNQFPHHIIQTDLIYLITALANEQTFS